MTEQLERFPEESDDEFGYRLVCQNISANQWGENDTLAQFIQRTTEMGSPSMLELGTRRTMAEVSTRHQRLFPHAGEYLGTDIEKDADVDFLADVHRLSQVTGQERFDAILSDAGFEHFKYPHLAAHELMKTLKIGGFIFIQTHQTFPIHAVPFDYFRFSTDALRSLFSESMGMKVHAAGYFSPAAIYSRVDPLGRRAPAFLHVNILAEKTAKTPDQYIYEYDCLPSNEVQS